jgi:MYXO-CTERM domain-containing protein
MTNPNDWTGVNLPANATAPFVATYLPTACVNPVVNLDCNLPQNTPDGMTHHIHGTPVFWDHGDNTAAVYVWGENEVVKGYNYDKLASRLTGWFANGTIAASIGTTAAPTIVKPGGMPGGMLTLSANGGQDGVVWGTFPIKGDANRTVLAGGLAAFDATTLALLWRSDTSTNGGVNNAVGSMSKFAPPMVVNGKVYVSTYSNKMDVYGVAGAGVGIPATTYTSMYLRGTFNNQTKQAGMGRLATNTWTQTITINASTDCFKFDVLGDGTTTFGGVNAATGTAVQGATASICPDVLAGEYTVTFNDATKDFSVVQLTIGNQPPIADAGTPISVPTGTTVMFNGTASHDTDGSVTSYKWSSIAFPAPLTGASPSFAFTKAGMYTVVLTVTDNGGATATASVIVTVSTPSAPNGDGGDGGVAGAAGASGDAGNTVGAGSGGKTATAGGGGNAGTTTNPGSAGDTNTPEAGQPSTTPSTTGDAGGGCACTTSSGGSKSSQPWLLATLAALLLRQRRRRVLADATSARRS